MPCIDFTKNFQVVVLLGGLGKRLGRLTAATPKPMVDILGRPFFSYMFDLLRWHGFKKFHFCLGHHGQMIQDYFRDGSDFKCRITYSHDGQKLLGTAGALRKAIHHLDKNFLLIYGDSYMDIDYNELIYRYHNLPRHKKLMMTVFHNNDRYDKSNVLLRNGRIIFYSKKIPTPDMHHIDYGISILNKNLITNIPENKFTDIADIYTNTIDHGFSAAHLINNRFYEIGTPDSLNEFRDFIQKRRNKQKAVILDRDGTLNEIIFDENTERCDSPLSKSDFKLLPDTCRALKILKSLGYLLIVVSNQPAAAKGKTTLATLYDINNRMTQILQAENIKLDEILICPHHQTGIKNFCRDISLIADCPGRKPNSLLIKQAIEKYNIDVKNSFMAGDSHVDILAGQSQKLNTVFIGRYKCDCCQLLGPTKPDFVFKNLYQFAKHLEDQKK